MTHALVVLCAFAVGVGVLVLIVALIGKAVGKQQTQAEATWLAGQAARGFAERSDQSEGLVDWAPWCRNRNGAFRVENAYRGERDGVGVTLQLEYLGKSGTDMLENHTQGADSSHPIYKFMAYVHLPGLNAPRVEITSKTAWPLRGSERGRDVKAWAPLHPGRSRFVGGEGSIVAMAWDDPREPVSADWIDWIEQSGALAEATNRYHWVCNHPGTSLELKRYVAIGFGIFGDYLYVPCYGKGWDALDLAVDTAVAVSQRLSPRDR